MHDLAAIAQQTLKICRAGRYRVPSGTVELKELLEQAIAKTKLHRTPPASRRPAHSPIVEVTTESTYTAAQRLVNEGVEHVALLNFANAVEPGGGFLHGARAQEEALCRCSGLYLCLTSPEAEPYYREQVAAETALALDHVLVSPRVPFFRDDDLELLDRPLLATVLTAAAPDLGWLHATTSEGLEPTSRYDELPALFAGRTRGLVAHAEELEAGGLVLGAWGCGAFGNEPVLVARSFAAALLTTTVPRVVFAIHGGPPENLRAFQEVLVGGQRG